MTVWVVTACRGEYSDRSEWVDSVWATESEALTRAHVMGVPEEYVALAAPAREHAHRVAREWAADPRPGTLADVIARERTDARRRALVDAAEAECSGCRVAFNAPHSCWAKRTRALLKDMEVAK